ncbi:MULTISPECIES: RrF2 family transcriptional regulator [Fusobacterium]|jgi:Rrf2 family iron-sulfur cluster assembly transcriptional regulator|uniref:Rrf2 family transcriptional regulator n=1 Tax=Fusobacterium varium ATCC 27725 TaxID=469618 RepID=A0ABN5JDC9_FUSVA|nr:MULTISPECIES: Rrf2 family transcriptional regulator [Fusobacterium]AVQ29749.1 Rrf2 family transcriptional regulator [Fusobacterium varium ATCC 27725]EES65037.2 transcriptional regulator, Rrf2 family [Fusobacterium varium ATCC 27725]MCD7980175.1 Rrf2 family transcriptional regulator [Fusobacterium sp.]MCF0171934.1 Rrf2 family transcriptional regulator [Fusobacterium varium]MCF2673096.1 Rrf2 family transcriptional regulator [Fusobacterium varium]
MKITQESDYAIKIVLYLSKLDKGEIANAREISEAEKMSMKFALKILRRLCKVKLVESFRGIKGGYKLKKSADDISLRSVIEVIQGDLFINTSLKNINSAKKVETDPVNSLLYSIQEDVKRKLSNTSFKDLRDASAK